jgi:hypothetical protein
MWSTINAKSIRSVYVFREQQINGRWSCTNVRSLLTPTLTLARPPADYLIEYAGSATRLTHILGRRIQPSAYMHLPFNLYHNQGDSRRSSPYVYLIHRSRPPLPWLRQPLDRQHSWIVTRKRKACQEGRSHKTTRRESMEWLGNNSAAAVQTSMSPRLKWTSGSRDGTALCTSTTQACTACTSPHSAAPQAPIPPFRPATHTAPDRP